MGRQLLKHLRISWELLASNIRFRSFGGSYKKYFWGGRIKLEHKNCQVFKTFKLHTVVSLFTCFRCFINLKVMCFVSSHIT